MVKFFSEITDRDRAGGKGRTLALLRERNIRVPDGLVLLPEAFEDSKLKKSALELLKEKSSVLSSHPHSLFAVRSSAEGEDSETHSFAGGFDSLLNVKVVDLIRSAEDVHSSMNNARAEAYTGNLSIEALQHMAVVIQPMVKAQYSGVVFSADPVSGRYEKIIGNAVAGLGEDLVSGEKDSMDFTLHRDSGKYEGPIELRKSARKLFGQIHAIEKILAGPVDVEWSWDGKNIHILQARAITTLSSRDPRTGGQNDSLTGHMLWSNGNVAEAVPDVMTPATWSFLKVFHEAGPIPWVRIVPGAANICGRPYMNLSYMISIYQALGKDYKDTGKDEFFGNIPDNMDIPLLPQRKKDILPPVFKAVFTSIPRYKGYAKDIPAYLESNPQFVSSVKEKLESIDSPEDLLSLWESEILPRFQWSCIYLRVATIPFGDKLSVLRKKLNRIVDPEITSDILSDLGGSSSSLVSLNLVRGISAIQKGDLTREKFIEENGFRGPHEFELSLPDMQEDPSQLEDYLASPSVKDPGELLANQQKKASQAWIVLKEKSMKLYRKYRKDFNNIAELAAGRERVRAEMIRIIRLLRRFYLKAGQISGMDDSVFFLYYTELIESLKTGRYDKDLLEERKKAHNIYSSIPFYPPLIKGAFDPEKWWNSSDRRSDIADSNASCLSEAASGLTGRPASNGIVEGIVRIIERPERGKDLKEGEILVASTTNVGWTPYFLKAGGVITDVGAPLSHAAIVARELGIPAIVGCGHATSALKTGQLIRMNGGTGEISLLSGGDA